LLNPKLGKFEIAEAAAWKKCKMLPDLSAREKIHPL
jgi:hypothetical protein